MRTIYRERIISLAKEFKLAQIDLNHSQKQLEKIKESHINSLSKIEAITNNADLSPNKKFEEINIVLEEVEVISQKMNKIINTMDKRVQDIAQQKKILFKICIENTPHLTIEKLDEIFKYELEKAQ